MEGGPGVGALLPRGNKAGKGGGVQSITRPLVKPVTVLSTEHMLTASPGRQNLQAALRTETVQWLDREGFWERET